MCESTGGNAAGLGAGAAAVAGGVAVVVAGSVAVGLCVRAAFIVRAHLSAVLWWASFRSAALRSSRTCSLRVAL